MHEDRFIVSIKASDKLAFARLLKYDIYNFRRSVSFDVKEKEFSIDAAVTLDQISLLVRDGYTVSVKKYYPVKGLPPSQIFSTVQWVEPNPDKENGNNELSHHSSIYFPPRGYYDSASINLILWILSVQFPSICKLYTLPESSHEGRVINYIKIAGGPATNRQGVLFIAGVHGEELVNPDLLASFACDLCTAYKYGEGLEYGGKTYSYSSIKQIVEALDIFVVPIVNPDGRNYTMYKDVLWRKNMNPNPGYNCKGVDINRNFDFLWRFNIYSSPEPCDMLMRYKGINAFSEPETRNVRFLLDNFPHIRYMIDIHSFSELVTYPWADDTNQSTDPSMNFQNPLYDGDGVRGITAFSEPPGYKYSEYIPQSEWTWYVNIAQRVTDAIKAVRGRPYKAIQSSMIYHDVFGISTGVCGSSQDYAYSRNLVDPKKPKVFSLTLETGRWFNPVEPERNPPPVPLPNEKPDIISEVSAGLVEFCLSRICVVEETVRSTNLFNELVDFRKFRDTNLLTNRAGTVYVAILEDHTSEIIDIMKDNRYIHSQTLNIITRLNKIIKSSLGPSIANKQKTKPVSIDERLLKDIEDLLELYKSKASPSLCNAIEQASIDLKYFLKRTVKKGLETANKEHYST